MPLGVHCSGRGAGGMQGRLQRMWHECPCTSQGGEEGKGKGPCGRRQLTHSAGHALPGVDTHRSRRHAGRRGVAAFGPSAHLQVTGGRGGGGRLQILVDLLRYRGHAQHAQHGMVVNTTAWRCRSPALGEVGRSGWRRGHFRPSPELPLSTGQRAHHSAATVPRLACWPHLHHPHHERGAVVGLLHVAVARYDMEHAG